MIHHKEEEVLLDKEIPLSSAHSIHDRRKKRVEAEEEAELRQRTTGAREKAELRQFEVILIVEFDKKKRPNMSCLSCRMLRTLRASPLARRGRLCHVLCVR